STIPYLTYTDPTTTHTPTLSLHDALPIYLNHMQPVTLELQLKSRNVPPALESENGPAENPQEIILDSRAGGTFRLLNQKKNFLRSEEHTSELQSLRHLVCRLLLEKKKKNI